MKKRDFWLDHIRAIACLLVVLLHTSATYQYQFNKIPMQSWDIANIIQSFTRVSVPLFFMISGYLMMQEKPARIKHFVRIILSILFYSSICLVYIAYYRGEDWKSLLLNIYHKPVFYHLWFFYAILSFYLLSNIISYRNNNKLSIYIILLCMIALNPGINIIINEKTLNLSSKFQYNGTMIFYMFYGMAGVCLGNTRSENNKKYVILFYIMSAIIIIIKTYESTLQRGSFVSSYYSNHGPLVAVGTLSLFYHLSSLDISNIYYKKTILFISNLSLPIYGVHAILLDYLRRSGNRDFNNPFVDIPISFTITLSISILLAMIIKKLDRFKFVS